MKTAYSLYQNQFNFTLSFALEIGICKHFIMITVCVISFKKIVYPNLFLCFRCRKKKQTNKQTKSKTSYLNLLKQQQQQRYKPNNIANNY